MLVSSRVHSFLGRLRTLIFNSFSKRNFQSERESILSKTKQKTFLSSWQQEQPNFWFHFPQREEKESRSFSNPSRDKSRSASKSLKFNMPFKQDVQGPASQMGKLRIKPAKTRPVNHTMRVHDTGYV